MNKREKGKDVAESSYAKKPRPTPFRIPGPASQLEEVLARRAAGEGTETMNTQEFVQRALTVASEDTDFVTNRAWLTAIQEGYLQHPGYTELANVHKVKETQRFQRVVGLIKSCKRREYGEDYAAELKDPTSICWASIHFKASNEEMFPGILEVGSCLVLKDIVAFRLSKLYIFFNVTVRNVERVIEKSMLD
ncbi:hypothetical protein Vadar_015122 [Vaccinium darrowii]|uniref:Uncharacterized protein n=1 Tax=Vaccinium darrowii TaxID=229202 RepID=A0ACB7YM88_9ERIC|nr:hypothetical protein Vadar_015122 [Vaccinium darrowii]